MSVLLHQVYFLNFEVKQLPDGWWGDRTNVFASTSLNWKAVQVPWVMENNKTDRKSKCYLMMAKCWHISSEVTVEVVLSVSTSCCHSLKFVVRYETAVILFAEKESCKLTLNTFNTTCQTWGLGARFSLPKTPNMAHWKALENVKEGRHRFWTCTAFTYWQRPQDPFILHQNKSYINI